MARAGSFFARSKLRLSGVAFLLVIVGLVGLTVAIYNKTFSRVAEVTLEADRIGNQLSPPADVKLRGLVVGEVRKVSSSGDGARLQLALDPDKVALIPKNVTAQLLPKTLFGEKFVDLVLPAAPSATHLRSGDVIPQDRSTTARETAKAVDDLLPLLQTLKPAQLSMTLNALSGALRGRGDRLGRNFVLTDEYLKQLNPELPTLKQDFRGLADFSDTLDSATPDLLRVLDNFSFSSRSLVDQQDELAAFLRTTAGFNDSATSILSENETRFITLASSSLPSLQTYARYSPEFPCLAAGLRAFEPRVNNTFGGLQPGLHITLEVVKSQMAYKPGDQPQFKEDRGARCYGNPNPKVPAQDEEFKDGYRDSQRAGIHNGKGGGSSASTNPAAFLAGPSSQKRALDAVAASVMGVPVDDVPDVVGLLLGPVARGTEVGLA